MCSVPGNLSHGQFVQSLCYRVYLEVPLPGRPGRLGWVVGPCVCERGERGRGTEGVGERERGRGREGEGERGRSVLTILIKLRLRQYVQPQLQ